MTAKTRLELRLLGMELYFDDLPRARDFFQGVLGLPLEEEQPGHHAKFAPQGGFLCLERKGIENYPSQDKAVVFLEVADLRSFVACVGKERFVRVEFGATPPWAVLHDPESHNVVCIEATGEGRGEPGSAADQGRDE
jgi:catechol 2,3-dioxygenase-like lactoylglutathione lyase family enzyme